MTLQHIFFYYPWVLFVFYIRKLVICYQNVWIINKEMELYLDIQRRFNLDMAFKYQQNVDIKIVVRKSCFNLRAILDQY